MTRGNYDIYSWITALSDFTFVYSETTMKITITNTEKYILLLYSNTIYSIGCSNDAQQSISNSLTSNQIINLVGPQMLYFSIPNISVISNSIKNTRYTKKSIRSSFPISSLQVDTQIHNISTLRQGVNDKVITHLEIN